MHIDKLEDADFKYDNNFFKLQLKKGPNIILSVSNLQFFVFQETEHFENFDVVDFKHDSFSKFLPKNTQTRLFQWKVKSYKLKVHRTFDEINFVELNFLFKNKITN